MFYTVYKITNKVNGKIYIGVHKTSDLNDGYMGSGKLIKAAIEKYGIENFDREYLKVFDNPEDMFNMESELVNEEFVSRDDTYNLKIGGEGGWDHLNSGATLNARINSDSFKNWNLAGVNAVLVKLENDKDFKDSMLAHLKIASMLGVDRCKELYPEGLFFGRTHSDETKRKIGQANSIKLQGNKNPQFGKIWITNSELRQSTRIDKNDIIPAGWIKGRKIYK